MNWHFLPELEAEFSGDCSADSEPCAPLKSTPSVGRCSSDAKWMDSFRDSLSGTTSELSMEGFGTEKSTSSPRDFHANHSALPAPESEKMIDEICGQKQLGLFPRSNQDLFCSKTCPGYVNTCPWLSETCVDLVTEWNVLPLLPPPPWVRDILDGVSGYLPTATASEYGTNQGGGSGRIEKIRPSIRRYLATPRASDSTRPGNVTESSKKHCDLRLGGPTNPEWIEWFMGFPIGWTALDPLATDKFRQWLDSHGKSYTKDK
jgi:hypothetical protein